MENNEKTIEMKEETGKTEGAVIEAKPTFKDKIHAGWQKHKKKVLMLIGAGIAIGGAAALNEVKHRKDAAAAQAEEDRKSLAEEWYEKGLADARKELPESVVDVEYTETEETVNE